MQSFIPSDLQSLFEVFGILEGGASVWLSAADDLDSGYKPAIPALQRSHSPVLGFYSSGSTGDPKLCWRSWQQLRSEARVSTDNTQWTWASPFSPRSFAGVQVAVQAWASGGRALSLPSRASTGARLLYEHSIKALSCTPTYLDLMLQQAPAIADRWKPAQITLGGEPLRAAAGSRFQKAFSNARFTVVYASAEHGVLLKTHRLDGWYELWSLEKRFSRWRVVDGELEVEKEGKWRSTRDRVEINGKVVRVIGRGDRVANVAGSKVSLEKVARLAEEVPGVQAADAFAEPSSVCGEIVVLRFAPAAGISADEVQGRVEEYLRANLRKEAWPRRWEAGSIELGNNAKRRCGAASAAKNRSPRGLNDNAD